MAHWLTNKGKLELMQGAWDDAAAGDIKVLLLTGAAAPAAIDTAAEVADVNFVTDLLNLTGVDECTGTGYARKVLTRSNATEDDTNDRVNLDAADVTYTGADFGTAYAAVFFRDTGSDATSPVYSIDIFASALVTNTGDVTYAIADVYRAS